MNKAPVLYDPYNRPLPALRRPRSQNPFGKRQAYEGGEESHLLADWITPQISADEAIYPYLLKVRNRCRSLERDNPYMRRFLSLMRVNVFGWTGIDTEIRVRHERRRDRPHKELNDAIDDEFDAYCELGNYDASTKFSGPSGDVFTLRRAIVDGELFVHLVRGFDNPWRFAVNFIEADAIDHEYFDRLRNGNIVTMGVEHNAWGRPMGYWIRPEHDIRGTVTGPRVRLDAAEVIHVGVFERSPQSRCMPWVVSAINSLRQFAQYELAQVIAARVCASKMGFIERDVDSSPYTGAEEDEEGNLVTEIAPGLIELLDPGQTFKPFNPGDLQTDFPNFRKAMLRGVACAFDCNYNSLGSDAEGVNYSSWRHGSKDDHDIYRFIQGWFIELVRRRIFRAWLEMATLAGRIDVSGFGYEDVPVVMKATEFKPRGWDYVDPTKDAHADVMLIANKLDTRTNVAARRGLVFEDILEHLAEEEDLAEEYGLDLSPVGVGGGGAKPAPAAGGGGGASGTTGTGTGEPAAPSRILLGPNGAPIISNGWHPRKSPLYLRDYRRNFGTSNLIEPGSTKRNGR